MGDTTTATALTVQVSFSVDIDASAWAGSDGDTMTTREVANEVQDWLEAKAKDALREEGVLVEEATA